MLKAIVLLVVMSVSGCAAVSASAKGGPTVSVQQRALLVDGEKWFDATDHRQQFLRTLELVDGPQLLVQLSDLSSPSEGHLLTVTLASGLMLEGRMSQPLEAYVSGMIRDGALTRDRKVNEDAFRAWAEKSGAQVSHRGDLDRLRKLTIVNRHPRAVRFRLVQEQLTGKRVDEVHELGPQASGSLTVLLGDTVCLISSNVCIRVEQGLKSLVISLDGARFE